MNSQKWFVVVTLTAAFAAHVQYSRRSLPARSWTKEIEAEMKRVPPANRAPASKAKGLTVAPLTNDDSALAQEKKPLTESVRAVLAAYDKSISWNFHQDGHENIFSIFGGVIPHILDSQPRTLAFARSITEALGFERDQIFLDADMTAYNLNPHSTTYNFKQQFEGFEVYNSYLRLFGRKEDGGVYYINNELKDVGQPTLDFRVTQSEAVNALHSIYPQYGVSVEQSSSKPLLLVLKPGVSELVWKLIVRVQGAEKDRREILISANTASVLQNESLVIRN